MNRKARYRNAEIKAGIWIFISLIIFAGFLVSVTGSKFWSEMDIYSVRLDYIGGLEIGSQVRVGGMAVGKIVQVDFLETDNASIELTIAVRKGLNIKSNTVAYLSFVSITSEHHLELDPQPAPAPLLKPGDMIQSKDLTTIDGVMEQMSNVGDTLKVILHRVNLLLNPQNLARIDSIIAGVNDAIYNASSDLGALLDDARQSVIALDTLINSANMMLAGSDSLVRKVMLDTRETIRQATITLAGIDTTVSGVESIINNNASSLNGILSDMEHTSENLKIMTDQIKDNPFLLIRSFPRKERGLK
ncbi:MAG: MCE family protein [Candidatus Glassbacteria bacterium]|nr:MCE family protein [Candidatus Glassbacteria bacterium]